MTKHYLKQGYAVIVSLLLFCTSCGDLDLFDTDKWSDSINLKPNLTVPLAYGSFTLWDLLLDSTNDYIQKEAVAPGSKDSVLVIKYTQNNIYELENLSEVFDMPVMDFDFQIPEVTIPQDLVGETTTVPVYLPEIDIPGVMLTNIPAGCDLKEIIVSAKLHYVLPQIGFRYTATISFQNIYKVEDGTSYSTVLDVTGAAGEDILLPNVLVEPDAQNEIKSKIMITIPAGVTITAGNISGLALALNEFSFIKAVGQVVIDPLDIAGDFDMDIDFLNEIGGNFTFTQPEVKLVVKNHGIGVPADLNLSLWVNEGTGKNERFNGEKLPLAGNPKKDLVEQTVSYTGRELADFLSLPPTGKINYEGKVAFNPLGSTTDNVVWSDGGIALDAVVRIPLILVAEDLQYRDTIDDIDLKDADKIVSAKITIVADNEIPLNLTVKGLILLTENRTELSTIKADQVLEASKHSVVEIKLTEQNVKDLPQSKYIVLDIGASTPSNTQASTISPNAKLKFKLIIGAQADLNNLDF